MKKTVQKMPSASNGRRTGGLLPIALLLTACQSTPPVAAKPVATPAYVTATSCEKADAMWNDRILASRYAQLPPLTSVGFSDFLAVTNRAFSRKAFTNEGDELEAGRKKRIHAFGAEARLNYEPIPSPQNRYTGVFQSGAACAIGRFSLANKPTADTSIPALAIKFFVDGNHPSLNVHLMNSVDGQAGHDFFATEFSNILPPARAFATQLLDRSFRAVAEELGARDPNPGRLTLDHLASMQPDGTAVRDPVAPYRIILKPTATARSLMPDAGADDDFRVRLAALPTGVVIYDVLALDADEAAAEARLIGRLRLASPVVSSRYGDETLYFQHYTERR